MAAKGTTKSGKYDDDEDVLDKNKDIDPADPASQPGNTGNSPSVGPGVKTRPTPEEDEEAKERAKQTNEDINEQLGSGYRGAAQIEAKAIAEGDSLLGKEAVVVQDDRGHPKVAVRGMPETATQNASATNPALAANDAVPPPPVDEPSTAEKAKLEKDGKVVVPLHGTGSQPSSG